MNELITEAAVWAARPSLLTPYKNVKAAEEGLTKSIAPIGFFADHL
jgi:hypothetical protein